MSLERIAAGVGQGEHGPIGARLVPANFNAVDDTVWSRCRRHPYPITIGFLRLNGIGQIQSRRVGAHIDRLDRVHHGCRAEDNGDEDRYRVDRAQETHPPTSP